MESSFFYKLPKDVLVSLLMKTYDKKLIYQLQKEFQNIINEDMKRLKNNLNQKYYIGDTIINYVVGYINVVIGGNSIFRIFPTDYSRIVIWEGINSYHFSVLEISEFKGTLHKILQVYKNEEDRNFIISKIIFFIQTYYELYNPLESLTNFH